MSLASYPIQLKVRDRAVLVVGAGAVAARKLARLVACGARIRVVASHSSRAVRRLAETNAIELHERPFVEADTHAMFLVIAATDDRTTNELVARCARQAGALVLRVDAPDDSDFTLPALVETAHVAATLSTRGKAPAASRRLGRELRSWLSRGPDRFVAELSRVRGLPNGRPDQGARLRALAEGDLFEACCAGDEARIRALVTSALEAP